MTSEEIQRAALQRFFDSYGRRSRNGVCKAAGVSESAVRAFIKGDTHSLDLKTYRALSKYSKRSIAQLMGEETEPSSSDKMHEKNHDSERNSTHTGVGTDTSPDAEGKMTEQDRLRLIDDIWEIPLHQLEGVKKYINGIKAAQSGTAANPRERGKTAL